MHAERRLFHDRVVVVALLEVLLMTLPEGARAETAPADRANVLFILDGSGSMWGQVEGQVKITAAKEVMADLIRDLPETVDAGLLAYGHRRKGDCNDIETLVPLGEGGTVTLIDAIQAINPKGKMPITRSLEVAAEQLRALEEEATVVLVSDGEETCNADPCARLRALKEGASTSPSTSSASTSATRRAASSPASPRRAVDGYFTADNAPQLREAFREVKQEIVQKAEPQPTPETKKRTIALAAPGKIVVNPPSVPSVLASNSGYGPYFKVLEAEAGRRIGTLHRKETSKPVPAGSYSVELNGSTMTVNVGAGETVEMPTPAVIEIANLEAQAKGPGVGPIIRVRNVDSGLGPLLHRGQLSDAVWPGTYQVDLSAVGGGVETVTLTAGEVVTLDLGGAR